MVNVFSISIESSILEALFDITRHTLALISDHHTDPPINDPKIKIVNTAALALSPLVQVKLL
jgi:hypothetical protein